MLPNATKYANKLKERFYRAKQKQQFGKKMQDYKDGSGSQFINFDFVTGGQEIIVSIQVDF